MDYYETRFKDYLNPQFIDEMWSQDKATFMEEFRPLYKDGTVENLELVARCHWEALMHKAWERDAEWRWLNHQFDPRTPINTRKPRLVSNCIYHIVRCFRLPATKGVV